MLTHHGSLPANQTVLQGLLGDTAAAEADLEPRRYPDPAQDLRGGGKEHPPDLDSQTSSLSMAGCSYVNSPESQIPS